jgi:hypothetical protein
MLERGEVLWKVDWPELNGEALTTLARWVAGVLLAAGIVAFLSRRVPAILSRLRRVPSETRGPPKVEA